MALLTAASLIVFIIEAQIPVPVPVPGAKLGLSNAVTLFALFCDYGKSRSEDNLTAANVFLILICRIILGAVFTGRVIAFIHSLAGGLLAFAVMVVLKNFVTNRQIWVCSAVGAVFHNIGQIITAVLITGTPEIAAYLPVLVIAGIVSGTVTGWVAQLTVNRLAQRGSG